MLGGGGVPDQLIIYYYHSTRIVILLSKLNCFMNLVVCCLFMHLALQGALVIFLSLSHS